MRSFYRLRYHVLMKPVAGHLTHVHNTTKKQTFLSFSSLAFTSDFSKNPHSPFLKTRFKRRELANFLQLYVSDNPVYYKMIHGQIVVLGFESDTLLLNILLKAYSICNHLDDARKLFGKMCSRNLITWSTMISGHAQHGYNEDALLLFSELREVCDESPNGYILASLIRSCTQMGNSGDHLGFQIHGFIVKSGFSQDVYVGTALINFYAKNISVDEARVVFDDLVEKNEVTWTTIIAGYVKSGRSEVSLQLFNQMRKTNIVPDKYVLSSVLNACSVLEFVKGGKQIHAYVLRKEGGTDMDVSVINVLIDFYVKCGKVKAARRLFDQMVVRDVISWTTMIAGYMQNSFDREAIALFTVMARLGWEPDGFACTTVLTSCGSLEVLEHGRQVHAYTIKANLEKDEFVKNGLIDMYAKCDSLVYARRLFNDMTFYNVISYNAIIEGYSRQDKLLEALGLFHEMRLRLLPPSLLTFVSLLGLSASLLILELSKQIHGLLFKFGLSEEILVGSALVDVYSKCSFIKDARLVFDQMNEKDIVVWNAMFFGYTQQLENEEALRLYSELQLSGERPNEFTSAALITASSNLASLQHGQQIHNQIIKMGLEFDPFVTNALVDMYANCGSLEEAHKTFSSTIHRDVVCWNSMITSYANHGEAKRALKMFEEMITLGIKPNYITFVGVLSACSHAGLVEDGFQQFESIPQYGVEQGPEHYACMVSLLARSGKLYEAREFIEKMAVKPSAVIWRSLLTACRVAGDIELGKHAAEMATSIDPADSGSYILLSNILASKGMWADVKKVRERMDYHGVVKEPGCSWIEVNNEVHVFIARDTTNHISKLIYSVLDNLILQMKDCYIHDTITLLLND